VENVSVELFGHPGNNAIVRMPGRAFPGVLVQGDTLASLRDHLARAERTLYDHTDVDAVDHIGLALDQIDEMLDRYERALTEHGLQRPYDIRRPRSGTSGGAEQQS